MRVNKLDSCYFRPLVMRGYGDVGVMPTKDNPIETYIACWEWGKYLGEEALAKAWMCASPAGPASRPTPCPRWPKPARIT